METTVHNWFSWPPLRRTNNWLTAMLVLLGLYIILLPFVPAIEWWLQYQAPLISHQPYVATPAPSSSQAPKVNTLIIPTLGMTEAIHDGPTEATLRYGVWHLPKSSSPDKGSNMVMAGHRFTYAGAAVFYNLDKVKPGQGIFVYWQGRRYDYKIRDVLTVLPTATYVEKASKKPMLTIYTCTPLWSTSHRLVIQADLVRKV